MLQILNNFDVEKRFIELVNNIVYLEALDNKQILINPNIEFVTPLSIVPLLPIIKSKQLDLKFENSYLDTICFPDGVKSLEKLFELDKNKFKKPTTTFNYTDYVTN